MNITLKIITSIFIVLLPVSCENSGSNNDDLVVLEGYLYQGEAVDSIHLTKAVSFESGDTIFPPVTDAEVVLNWKNNAYELSNLGDGYYSYQGNGLQVNEGDNYSIAINYDGQTITSSTTVPQKPKGLTLSDTILYADPPGSGGGPIIIGGGNDTTGIRINWEDTDNSYYFAVIESTDPNAANIRDTGNMPGFTMSFRLRTEPFKGDEYRINQMVLQKYGRHRVKIYHVTQEYTDLYENRSQDSRNLTEPLTNVINGLGIFTAFSYAEGYFQVKKEE